jgi:hypothetical protein
MIQSASLSNEPEAQRSFPLLPAGKPAPNFFVVGAMRGGTTAIASALQAHRQIFFCPIKEPGFFSTDIAQSDYGAWHRKNLLDPVAFLAAPQRERKHLAYVDDPALYAALFQGADGFPAVGEASTAYLFSETAAAAIAAAIPDARIVISLRDPYERAISEYLMNKAIGTATGSFSQALERERRTLESGKFPYEERYVFAGLYAAQVKRYLDHFPRKHILILHYEDIARDSAQVLHRICAHLGIDPAQGPQTIANPNPPKRPRFAAANKFLYRTGLKQAVSDWAPRAVKSSFAPLFYTDETDVTPARTDLDYLNARFQPDIAKLKVLIGDEVPSWPAR